MQAPYVRNRVGDVVSLKTSWKHTQTTYYKNPSLGPEHRGEGYTIPGESFTVEIQMSSRREPLSHTWSTAASKMRPLLQGMHEGLNETKFDQATISMSDILDEIGPPPEQRYLPGGTVIDRFSGQEIKTTDFTGFTPVTQIAVGHSIEVGGKLMEIVPSMSFKMGKPSGAVPAGVYPNVNGEYIVAILLRNPMPVGAEVIGTSQTNNASGSTAPLLQQPDSPAGTNQTRNTGIEKGYP